MNASPKREFSSYTPAELRELYETNPTDFNSLAADAIRQACIGKTETQTLKLRQMQWVIEGQLLKANTPLQKLYVMERIFYDQVYGSDGFIFKLNSAYMDLARTLKETDDTGGKQPVMRLVKNSSIQLGSAH